MLPRSSTMENSPHKMALFGYAICLLSLIPIIETATFRYIVCPPDIAFNSSNSTMSNGFTNSTLQVTDSHCIHDVSPKVCSDCINYAYRDAAKWCSGSMEVKILYDECQVTLSPVPTATIGVADQNSSQIPRGDPNFLYVYCPKATLSTTSTYTANSTYHTNLKSVLSNLSSNTYTYSFNGFYSFSAGGSHPDAAYGLFICRGDLSSDVCRACVTYAAGDVVERCPRSKQVMIWYDECILRYSNVSFFSVADTSTIRLMLINPQNATDVTSLNVALATVMDDVANRASGADSDKKKFATGTLNYTALQAVYGLAQCTPDLSQSDCYLCLRTGISVLPSCCDAKIGARVFFPSCYVHYEMYPFFNAGFGAPPPPPLPALPPPPSSTNATSSPAGKAGVSWQVVIAIVVPIGVFILLSGGAIFCFMTRRAKKNYNRTKNAKGGDDISTLQSLHYDLRTIQAATKNFSEDNKIGEGGFGQIYKASLPDGQDVAVKRLSRMSSQGVEELKNEVVLLAKLQHRNLVKLLGFCFEGEEKLLIFEFVPNKSLDSFLFDQQEQFLDWSRRYKIITGIARGMSYLHEDPQFRIIHRDLKASNILLDGDMNAKISDFGMAQILRGDQTQGNASEIVGTLGYMSPEYAMHGRFSIESDVFSFGVVVLEIITGMKSINFSQSDIAKDLLSYAWKFWNDGAPLHLMDPMHKGPYSKDEVIKCIHIALLCVEDDPSARPSMATVVAILDGYFATLSLPQQPAYHGLSRTGLELGRTSDKLLDCSMNEVSISELEPR